MNLTTALSILKRVHLRDDDEIGFVIQMGATPEPWDGVSDREYIDAWEAIHRATKPRPPLLWRFRFWWSWLKVRA